MKFERAKKHISDLDQCLAALVHGESYELFVKHDADAGHYTLQHRFTEPLPVEPPLIIGDAVHNLRSALDLAVCEIVRNANWPRWRKAKFPIFEKRGELKTSIEKGEIGQSDSPIGSVILDNVKAYKNGNYPLWALNQLDRMDKHQLLIPNLTVAALSGIEAVDANNNKFILRGAMILRAESGPGIFRSRSNITIKRHGKPTIEVLFQEGPLNGEPVLPTLRSMANMIQDIIRLLEPFG